MKFNKKNINLMGIKIQNIFNKQKWNESQELTFLELSSQAIKMNMLRKLNKKGQGWLWAGIIFFLVLGIGAIIIGIRLKMKARGLN